jgi:microcystin-dependent protein
MPSHSHAVRANSDFSDTQVPSSARSLARSQNASAYQSTVNQSLTSLSPEAFTPAGGDQPHNNLQPYLTFYFNIALQGVFPPRG